MEILTGELSLYNDDCLNSMLKLGDDSVKLWITSPPYAKQRNYNGAKEDDYLSFITPIIKLAKTKMCEDGSIVINIKENVKHGQRDLYVMKMIIHFVEVLGLNFIDEYIWVKTNPFPTGAKTRLKDGYERLLHFTKGKHKLYPNNCLVKSESKWLTSEKRRSNKGEHNTTNDSGMGMSKRISSDMVRPSNVITGSSSNLNIGHPAVFPEYIPSFFIKLMTEEGDLVGDPFMGSGTTALSCIDENRKFVGMELDKDYYDIAINRVAERLYL